jgi:hypothetical protein
MEQLSEQLLNDPCIAAEFNLHTVGQPYPGSYDVLLPCRNDDWLELRLVNRLGSATNSATCLPGRQPTQLLSPTVKRLRRDLLAKAELTH